MKVTKKLLKTALWVLLFVIIVSVSACSEKPNITTLPCDNGHTVVTDEAVPATCKAEGLTEGKHCSVCNEIILTQEVIPITDHTIVIDKEVEATCYKTGLTEGSHCSICNEIIIAQEEIAFKEHNIVANEETAPTCTLGGLSQGTYCSVCYKVIEARTYIEPLGHDIPKYSCTRCGYSKLSDPTLYFSDHGYEYLGTLENGEAMQKFYARLDRLALKFHNDTSLNLTEPSPFYEGEYLLAPVDYGDLGLSYDEAETVLSAWDNDRPIFYWLATGWSLNRNSGTIWLQAEDDFALGKSRLLYNSLIYSAIEEYVMTVDSLESAYMITLGYHNKILESIDYVYKSDGVTPMDATWAHSILGVFDERGVVCEGYAKTLQLLLNFSGVENYYVRGISDGESHAWNLIKMDDGEWYWCDPTWNDDTRAQDGIVYTYFCVTDTQNNSLFTKTHTFYTPSHSHPYNRIYPLPARSSREFDSTSVLEVYEDFVVNGNIYEVSGFKKARFIGTVSGNAGSIPSTVSYKGIVYTVEN